MTGYEIIILIAGLVFLVASFFFGGKNTPPEMVDVGAEIKKIKEAAVLHENEVGERVKDLIENECTRAAADAQERLSKISNDKIIAIDEYASQVLERIENNNQAVVFLYDMLQKKDEEMKSTMNKMEQTRRENKELFDQLGGLKQSKQNQADAIPEEPAAERHQKSMAGTQTAAMQNDKQTVVRNEIPQTLAELEHTQAGALTEALALHQEAEKEAALEAEDFAIDTEQDRQELILSMYRGNKSIKEISKQLSMGQGEVKLIIDLYAKKSE